MLMERCVYRTDGVGDQGAEYALWGHQSITHASLWRSRLVRERLSFQRDSTMRSLAKPSGSGRRGREVVQGAAHRGPGHGADLLQVDVVGAQHPGDAVARHPHLHGHGGRGGRLPARAGG
jgi:hypothetical protein